MMAPCKSPCAIIGTARNSCEIEEIVLVVVDELPYQARAEIVFRKMLEHAQEANADPTSRLNTSSIIG